MLLDPDDRVLLCRYEAAIGSVWATVGGGIEPGEPPEEAVARELEEAVGLSSPRIGPALWHRSHVFDIGGGFDGQQETFYLVRTDAIDLSPSIGWTGLAMEGVKEMRWWGHREVAASLETFAPRSLGRLLQELLNDGAPPVPIDVGV